MSTLTTRPYRPSFFERLTHMLAVIDHSVTWWGAHRAWPANEPARIDVPRG